MSAWVKWTAGVAGALIGAAICGIVVIVVWCHRSAAETQQLGLGEHLC